MKRLVILLFIGTLVLAACQPAAPVTPVIPEKGAGEVDDETLQKDTPVPPYPPAGGSDFRDEVGGQSSGAGGPVPVPDLTWDPDAETVVVSATFCCGFVPRLAVTNYIPDLQIFGDGRMVWVEHSQVSSSRQVLETQLTPDQMKAVLDRIVEAGFYDWNEYYSDPTVADAAEQCLQVNLLASSRSVCEYVEGAPEAFHELYEFLATGAGEQGQPFTPKTGYLTAEPLGDTIEIAEADLDRVWDASAAGVDLAKAIAGVWIEGEALAQAWQAVNASFWNPLAQDGDTYYNLGLQISGLSREAPDQAYP